MPSDEWELPSTLNMAAYTVDAGRPVSEWVGRAADIFRANRLVVLQDFFASSTAVQNSGTAEVDADWRRQAHDDAEMLSGLHQQLDHYFESVLARDADEGVLGNRSYQVGNAGRYTIGDWSSEPAFNIGSDDDREGHGRLGEMYLRAFAGFVERGGPHLLNSIGDYRLSSAGAQIVVGKAATGGQTGPGSRHQLSDDGLRSEFQMLHLDLSEKYVPEDETLLALPHPPMLQLHITTQEISRKNGAMRILPNLPPREEVYTSSREGQEETDAERRSQLAPLKVGTVVLRDVQVWHGGCPNYDDTRSARIWPFLSFYSTAFSEALVEGHRSGKLHVPLERSKVLQPWKLSEDELVTTGKLDIWRNKETFDIARKLIPDHLFPEKSPYRRWPRVVLQKELELIARAADDKRGEDDACCPDVEEECIRKLSLHRSKHWGGDAESFANNILGTLGGQGSPDLQQWNLRHKACREFCTSMENGKYSSDYDSWCEAVNLLEGRLLRLERSSGGKDASVCGLSTNRGSDHLPGTLAKRKHFLDPVPVHLEASCKFLRSN